MNKKKSVTVELDEKIKRGEKETNKISLRNPKAGELRGMRLVEVANADVDSMIKLIPRVSDPALTEQELADMNTIDFTKLAIEVAGFLEQKN